MYFYSMLSQSSMIALVLIIFNLIISICLFLDFRQFEHFGKNCGITNCKYDRPEDASTDCPIGSSLLFWGVFFGVYFVYSVVASWLAPTGYWMNTVFGSDFWYETDPGGAYLSSAIQLFESKHQYYFGHPGVTLHLILYAIVKCYYTIASLFDGDIPFYNFAARNLSMIFFLSKLCLSLFHFLSFYLVYRFTFKILKNDSAAVIAALVYATSFPVLYFLTRIAPEPIMVVFFLLTFIFIYEYQDREREGNIKTGLVFVSLSAVSAVLSFYTKIQLLGALPFYILFYLLADRLFMKNGLLKKLKEISIYTTVYLLSCAFTAFFCNLFVDWGRFFRTSSGYALGAVESMSSGLMMEDTFDKGMFILRAYIPRFLNEFVKPLLGLRGEMQGHIFWFILCELPFFVVVIIGAVFYFRHTRERSRAVWPLLYGGFTVFVWMYRLSFHYLFIFMLVAAVFFGYAADLFFTRFSYIWTGRFRLVRILLLVLAFHFIAILAAVNSKIYDVRQYNRGPRQIYRAMAMVNEGKHIALITKTIPSITLPYKSVMNSLNIFFPYFFPKEARFLGVIDKMFIHFTLSQHALQKPDDVKKVSQEDNVLDNIFLHVTVDYPFSQKPDAVSEVLQKNNVGVVLEEEDDSILGPFTLEEFEKERLNHSASQ